MACCDSCANNGPCAATCDAGGSRDRERNPSAVLVTLAAGETLGSGSVPEIIQVYQGPVFLELWSFDADTAWKIERVRIGREGQRVVTEQRVNSGPVSRRVVSVAQGERATVRAWARAVASGEGWNDITGRYTASTPNPYIQVLSYDDAPVEYGANAASAVSVAVDGTETIVAAHHARYLVVHASPAQGLLEVLDRAGTVISTRPLSSQNVICCADAWSRVRVTNSAGTSANIYWIATVLPPGLVQ